MMALSETIGVEHGDRALSAISLQKRSLREVSQSTCSNRAFLRLHEDMRVGDSGTVGPWLTRRAGYPVFFYSRKLLERPIDIQRRCLGYARKRAL